MTEEEFYRDTIIETVKKINDPVILKLICGFTQSGYREDKAGKVGNTYEQS